jgi:hypothetical protein
VPFTSLSHWFNTRRALLPKAEFLDHCEPPFFRQAATQKSLSGVNDEQWQSAGLLSNKFQGKVHFADL